MDIVGFTSKKNYSFHPINTSFGSDQNRPKLTQIHLLTADLIPVNRSLLRLHLST